MEFLDPKPIYLQIVDHMLQQIINAKWQPDERIQSVRELAAEVVVNPNTVVRAYNYLSDRSIIYQRRGKGYFLSLNAIELAMNHERQKLLEEQLPELFSMMKLLDIDIKEIVHLYQNHTDNEK